VRRLNGVDAINEDQPLEATDHQFVALITHDGIDRSHVADDRLNAAAKLSDDYGELSNFDFGETIIFREDHGGELKQKSRPVGAAPLQINSG
jgi:hypothetical protein